MIKFKCFVWFTFSLMMAAHGQDKLSIDVTCAINGELNGRVNIKIRGNYLGHEGSGPYTIEIDGILVTSIFSKCQRPCVFICDFVF